MSTFQPPPTWALPVLVDERTKEGQFNPIWLKWFVDLAQVLSSFGGGSGSADHNMLSNLQGGTTNQFYHLSQAQHAALIALEPFPVGSIFTSISPTNPSVSLGYGTWVAFGVGRVLVGVDISNPDFDTVEETGGSLTQTFSV